MVLKSDWCFERGSDPPPPGVGQQWHDTDTAQSAAPRILASRAPSPPPFRTGNTRRRCRRPWRSRGSGWRRRWRTWRRSAEQRSGCAARQLSTGVLGGAAGPVCRRPPRMSRARERHTFVRTHATSIMKMGAPFGEGNPLGWSNASWFPVSRRLGCGVFFYLVVVPWLYPPLSLGDMGTGLNRNPSNLMGGPHQIFLYSPGDACFLGSAFKPPVSCQGTAAAVGAASETGRGGGDGSEGRGGAAASPAVGAEVSTLWRGGGLQSAQSSCGIYLNEYGNMPCLLCSLFAQCDADGGAAADGGTAGQILPDVDLCSNPGGN